VNLIEFFEEYDVRYWLGGKNVSSGYVGIRCRFCDDDSNHLGIRIKDLQCSCWKCGGHSFPRLVQIIVGCPLREAKLITRNIEHDEDIKPQRFESYSKKKNILPENARDLFPRVHLEYLRSRGFSPKQIIRKYSLKAVYRSGKYKFRIIIPAFERRKMIAFTSRDVTNEQDPKYLAASAGECKVNPSEVIYNIDTVERGRDAILVEGPFDVFKMGDGAICFFGVQLTGQRLLKLRSKEIRRLFVFYDADKPGRKQARRIARIAAPCVRSVEILKIQDAIVRDSKTDPGSLSLDQCRRIKSYLDFNK
jgi:hypothetical protein